MHICKHAIHVTAFLLALICLFCALPVAVGAERYAALRGDIDGNGKIDAVDYMLLKRFILGTYYPSVVTYDVWDINGDRRIDAVDYMLLKRVVLGTYALPAPTVTDLAPPRPESPDPELETLFNAVNQVRRENRKGELVYRWDIQEAADVRAQEIVTLWDHERPNEHPFHSAIYELGVYGFCAEVLTKGPFGAETAVNLWMGSTAGHRGILLSSTMTGMVAGHTTVGDTQYWVALFVEEPYDP